MICVKPNAATTGPETEEERKLIENFRLLSAEQQEECVRYARYVADLPIGGAVLSLEEWRTRSPHSGH